ncbi:MAG: preprotein translocase subunit SecE [Eubacterium sp.]|nr:preprotein translocase subunit SecE [Eubacterium sp.]
MAKEKALSKEELKAKKANEKKSQKAAAAKKPKKSIVKYFKDTKSEFKKVVWPSRKTVFNNTVVVLITLVVSGIFVWGLDTLFVTLLRLALGMSVTG